MKDRFVELIREDDTPLRILIGDIKAYGVHSQNENLRFVETFGDDKSFYLVKSTIEEIDQQIESYKDE